MTTDPSSASISTLPTLRRGQEVVQSCCISFCSTDLIRLIDVPNEMVAVIRTCIQISWGRPIQKEQDFHGAYEFKLKGKPWAGAQDEDVRARRLVAAILTEMAKNGWNLLQSSQLTSLQGDNTMFFESGTPDPNAKIFSISLSGYDLIRVIDAPDIAPLVKQAVTTHWPKGIKREREYHGSVELKLVGKPWASVMTEHGVYARKMLLLIVSNVRGMGFKLYGSFNLWYHDSWFFRQPGPTWNGITGQRN